MATLTTNTFNRTGAQVDTGAAASAGGDNFANTGSELFICQNGSASPITITFAVVLAFDAISGALTIPNRTVSVPAGQTFVVGPFPASWHNDGTGKVNVTYSASASVTVRCVRGIELRSNGQ